MISFTVKIFATMCLITVAFGSRKLKSLMREEHFQERALLFLHLLCVGTLLGMKAWVTFVSGITMFKSIPRYMFGHLQAKLWPKFFRLATCLSLIAIVTSRSVWIFGESRSMMDEFQDTFGLTLAFLCGLANTFYLEPRGSAVWQRRIEYEQERGFGNEIGSIRDTEKLRSPKYDELTSQFSLMHGLSTLATMSAYIGCLVYLWNLSCHLLVGLSASTMRTPMHSLRYLV